MHEKTPESDAGSIECFQNYTAAEVFAQGLAGIVDQVDVESMIRAQKQMLQRFEKTNEMLSNCNTLSMNRLKMATTELKKYTTLLTTMKKDLNVIFKRTKQIRERLAQSHPTAYQDACKATVSPTEEEAPGIAQGEDKKVILLMLKQGIHVSTHVVYLFSRGKDKMIYLNLHILRAIVQAANTKGMILHLLIRANELDEP